MGTQGPTGGGMAWVPKRQHLKFGVLWFLNFIFRLSVRLSRPCLPSEAPPPVSARRRAALRLPLDLSPLLHNRALPSGGAIGNVFLR